MPKLLLCLALVCVTFCASGCGTALNCCGGKNSDRVIYGGTLLDATFVTAAVTNKPVADWTPGSVRWLGFCALIDLPMSIIGDTVTLPLTLASGIGRAVEKHESDVATPE